MQIRIMRKFVKVKICFELIFDVLNLPVSSGGNFRQATVIRLNCLANCILMPFLGFSLNMFKSQNPFNLVSSCVE